MSMSSDAMSPLTRPRISRVGEQWAEGGRGRAGQPEQARGRAEQPEQARERAGQPEKASGRVLEDNIDRLKPTMLKLFPFMTR